MFRWNPHKPHRLRRGAAALVAGAVALAGLGVVAGAEPASAASFCDFWPERCQLPTLSLDPYGAVDAPTFGPASVRVTGWASDLSVNAPIDVIVTVDGTVVGRATADLYRANVGYRGFDITVPASPASAQVCVTGVNVGAGRDSSLGCAPFPYSTRFTLLDECGVVSLPLAASKWALFPPVGQAVQEVTSSNAGRIGFISGPVSFGPLVGLSLSDGVMPGPVFRSFPTGALPANPNGGVNLEVPCPKRFTADELNTMLTGMPVALPPGVTITTSSLTPSNGALTLSVTGTATGSVGGLVPYSEPFRYSLTFTVTPSTDMNNPIDAVVVTPTGPGTLTFTGSWGWLLNGTLAPTMEPGLSANVRTGVSSVINSKIAASAADAFPSGLPQGATISAPRVVITPSGASLTVAVGWFG
jgi:hypothetical protein